MLLLEAGGEAALKHYIADFGDLIVTCDDIVVDLELDDWLVGRFCVVRKNDYPNQDSIAATGSLDSRMEKFVEKGGFPVPRRCASYNQYG